MFRFLKDLVKGAPPPASLGIDDLPAWTDGEEGRVRDDLAAMVAGRRPAVLGALDRMEVVLSGFDTASAEEVSRTKLAGVAERSLPLFLKAMKISLSRDLPEDPEGFYTVAGEILKGCLSAFRNQGRYLASRFPDEMKVLRGAVDTIGREVNALTPGMAGARERLRGLAEIRRSREQYDDARRRVAAGKEEILSLEEEGRGSRLSLEEVNRELAGLEEREEFRTCQGELARIRSLEEDLGEVARRHRAEAATALHLMKKGEKIASRKRDRGASRALHEAILLLEVDLPLPEDAASAAITAGQKAISAMADSGELPLKNREEMDQIREPERFVRDLLDISRRFRELSGEIASAREAVLSRPVLARSRDLKGRQEELEDRISRADGRLDLLKGEVAEAEKQAQDRLAEVRKGVEELSGKSVRLGEEGTSS